MLTPRLDYACFMLLAAAAFLVVQRLQPQTEAATLRWREKGALLLAAFIGGALGGKLPFVFSAGGAGLWAWTTDGKTITTAIAGAYLAVEATKWALGIRVKTGDAFALPIAVGLAIGRWGCFFGGCCYGVTTDLPWATPFEHAGVVELRHPTQIYESMFHASMAVVLLAMIRYDLLRRQRLKLYLIAYFLYRFLTEFIRPEPAYAFGLTWYQWTALGLIAALAVHWAIDERAKRKPAQAEEPEPRTITPQSVSP
ncbi:MAG: prolipoprotein diacylglyceryl transferase [Pirellulaceae bacterium]